MIVQENIELYESAFHPYSMYFSIQLILKADVPFQHQSFIIVFHSLSLCTESIEFGVDIIMPIILSAYSIVQIHSLCSEQVLWLSLQIGSNQFVQLLEMSLRNSWRNSADYIAIAVEWSISVLFEGIDIGILFLHISITSYSRGSHFLYEGGRNFSPNVYWTTRSGL